MQENSHFSGRKLVNLSPCGEESREEIFQYGYAANKVGPLKILLGGIKSLSATLMRSDDITMIMM